MNSMHSTRVYKSYVQIALNLNLAPTDKLFDGTSITPDNLDSTETIDVASAIQLVHNLLAHSRSRIAATILGEQLGVASHGPVGYAAISAPTVGSALSTFAEWFQIRFETYTPRIEERSDAFEIQIHDNTGDDAFKAFFFESFMRAFEILIALIIGKALKEETELHFEEDGKNRREEMKHAYDSTVYFNAPQNKIVVPKTLWYFTSPLADSDAFQLNIGKCQQLLEERENAGRIDLKVRNILRRHFEQVTLAATDTHSRSQALSQALTTSVATPPTQREICESVHITERTFIRRLKKCNTSFKQILEEERKIHAERLLKDARYTIFNIAELLGYKEPANFCRAFKKWNGQTPTEFRRQPDKPYTS
jgi:AraC-like DNA-binding protein